MIIDNDFLNTEEADGVWATVVDQLKAVNYHFIEDDGGIYFVHYAKSGVNSTRWEPVIQSVFKRFCEKHDIEPSVLLAEKIILVPPNSKDAKIVVRSKRTNGQQTFLYFVNHADGDTYIDDYEVPHAVGTGVAFEPASYHEGPRLSPFRIMFEVSYLL